jgi:cytidine deaminase
MLKARVKERLYAHAKKASCHSYSPYSNFPVGAAVLTASGRIFTGTNVENASFGLTICAEQAAIVNAVNKGHRDFTAIAIYCKCEDIMPCGACRQFIFEFGKNIELICQRNGKLTSYLISDLIPNAFTGKDIPK